MSKIVNFQTECPQCGNQYIAKVFRTLWGDGCTADNFESRLTDNTNIVTCPHCKHSFRLPLGLMYVDVQAGFAVWWEPQHDPGIDSDAQSYAAMFGANSYYATAPRIADWEEFKQVIREYYQGKRVGGKIEKMDINALKKSMAPAPKKKNGCLGSFVLIASISIAALSASAYGLYQFLI